ncbi:uncharacterized protein C2845_PM03G19600 [Panicum miliaceum]|uniref:Uncharacterized protein n=1 Tax=Panicum miliaceum TaxID=4540 RepID=A0A3L6T9B0_PANMI|nr:uncharacterized protein C2845_PM03G19600 [Panicum miliaceum]
MSMCMCTGAISQDSEEGGANDYLFISDSEDEISDEFMVAPDSMGSFLPDTEEQAPSMVVGHSPGSFISESEGQPLNVVEDQLVQDFEDQGGDTWQDIGSHAQPLEEEADADLTDPQEQDDGASNRFCEVRDSMLKILVPLYFQNDGS